MKSFFCILWLGWFNYLFMFWQLPAKAGPKFKTVRQRVYERIILIAPFSMFCCTMCKILCTYSLVKLLLLLYKVKCNNSAFAGQWKWFKIDQMCTSIYTTFYTMWYVCCCFVSVTNLKSSKEYNSFYLPAAVLKLIHSIQFQIFFNVMFWKYYFFSKFVFNQ